MNTGCKKGRYDQEQAHLGDSSDSDNDYSMFVRSDVALVARPVVKRRPMKKPAGKSSGEETVVLEKDRLVDPRDVMFTQNTVERTFSDGRYILNTMIKVAFWI